MTDKTERTRALNDALQLMGPGSQANVAAIVRHAPELVTRLVPALLSGQRTGCTALTEPGAGSDLSALQTQAVAVPGGWQLDGVKHWITNAVHADAIVVYAQTRAGAGAAGRDRHDHRDGFRRVGGRLGEGGTDANDESSQAGEGRGGFENGHDF